MDWWVTDNINFLKDSISSIFFRSYIHTLILKKEWKKKPFNILCLKQFHLSNSNSFFLIVLLHKNNNEGGS